VNETRAVLKVYHGIVRIVPTLIYPLSLDRDTRTFDVLKLHNRIRRIRFPTNRAISDGQVRAADLQCGRQAEISFSPLVGSGSEAA